MDEFRNEIDDFRYKTDDFRDSNMYSHSSNDASDLETVQLLQNDFDINLDIRRMC